MFLTQVERDTQQKQQVYHIFTTGVPQVYHYRTTNLQRAHHNVIQVRLQIVSKSSVYSAQANSCEGERSGITL